MGVISIVSLIFFLLVALDVSPYVRGPAPYPPDWRWAYYYVDTWDKAWVPLVLFLLLVFLFIKSSTRKASNSFSLKLVSILTIASFLFQLSVVYFSRSGIFVLFHRITNPELNGYFTAALKIESLPIFLSSFNTFVLHLPMHAQGHPPGAIVLFYFINTIAALFGNQSRLLSLFHPTHPDVLLIWNTLHANEKIGALFSSLFIPFVSSLSIFPLFLIGQKLYGYSTAVKAVFLYIFVPSTVLFIPINDVMLPGFSLWTFYFLHRAITDNKTAFSLLAGCIMFLGTFISISLMPVIAVVTVFSFFSFIKEKISTKKIAWVGMFFLTGLLFPYLLLYLVYGYNAFEVTKTLMAGLPQGRSYLIWVFYNMYDFFIFLGIPLSFFFVKKSITEAGKIKKNLFQEVDVLFWSVLIVLIFLNVSGFVRGEVARIWIPLVPFIILVTASFIAKVMKISSKQFVLLLFLQALQVIIMQEFWVTLW